MNFKREHPIRIVSKTSRFLILLVVPVFRALFFSGGNFQKWIQGAWIDISVLVCIIAFGIVSWYFDFYYLAENGAFVNSGIFKIKKSFYHINNISLIAFEQPWYLKIFNVARLRIDSPTDTFKKNDISILLSFKDADFIFDNLNKKQTTSYIKGNFLSILALSLLSSNGLTGAIYLYTLFSQAGNIFGSELNKQFMDQVTKTSRIISIGIPSFALTIGLLVIIGWSFSFILNLIRYSYYSINRNGNAIFIKNGLIIDKHKYCTGFKHINYVQIRQTIFTKILSIYSVFIGVVGYGKSKNEKSVLIPAFRKNKSLKSINTILPEFKFFNPQVKPPKKNFFRYLFVPLCFFLGIVLFVVVFLFLFPSFKSLIMFTGGMFWVADAFFFLIKIISFFESGVSINENLVCISYSKRFVFYRVCFDIEKLAKVVVRQTPFQKNAGACTLIFYLYGEKSSKHIIPHLDIFDVKKVQKLMNY